MPSENIKSFATLSGTLLSFAAAHPLCWRYVISHLESYGIQKQVEANGK